MLHDIADAKFYDGDDTVGPRKAKEFLESLGIDQHIIDHIEKIVKNITDYGNVYIAIIIVILLINIIYNFIR